MLAHLLRHTHTRSLTVCSANKWLLLLFVAQQLNTKDGPDILVIVPKLEGGGERQRELFATLASSDLNVMQPFCYRIILSSRVP